MLLYECYLLSSLAASARNCLIKASSSLLLVYRHATYALSAFRGTLSTEGFSFFDEPPLIPAYAAAPIAPNTPSTRCSLGIFIPARQLPFAHVPAIV